MAQDFKILQRIKALMAKTVENGCTEEEQDAATRMIAGLMVKHGIERSAVYAAEGTEAEIGRGKKLNTVDAYERMVAQAAGVLYGCKVIKYKQGKLEWIEFVGREDNVTAAEETVFWLLSQLGYFYKMALPKGLDKKDRAEFRRTFRTACAYRIYQRAEQFVEEASTNNQIAEATTGSTALVVKGYFEQLEEENNKYLEDSGVKKGRKSKFRLGSGSAAGFDAGDRVKLKKAHKEISQ